MKWSLICSACALTVLCAAGPAAAQVSVSRNPAASAPALGLVVRGTAATTFSVSTAGVVAKSSGDGIRIASAGVTAPTITVTCGALNLGCLTRNMRVTIQVAGQTGGGSISIFRVGALTGATYVTSAPAPSSNISFDLRPMGLGGTASFPLGMDVLVAANAASGAASYSYTVTAALQ